MITKLVQFLVCAVCSITLVSCVTNDHAEVSKEASKFSAVSISDPAFNPQPNNSFAWYSDIYINDSTSEVKVSPNARAMLKKLISNAITSKNYQISPNSANADYLVSAMVILGSENIEKAAPLFKLYPQISESINHYDDGTLFVAISQNQGEHAPIMWKSAIQAYVVGEDLSEEEQAVRLDMLVKRLMNDLP